MNHPTPDCAAALAAIQLALDGAPADAALDAHLAACPSCRASMRAAERLLGALPLLPRPEVRAGFAAQIARAVNADRRQRDRRRWAVRTGAGVAIAAGVLAAVWWPRTEPIQPVVQQREPEPPSIRERFEEARTAVASLTARTVPELPMPVEITLPVAADERGSTWEPVAQSLDEAANGAAVAFEPMTAAAGRAFGFLYREIPPLPPERKPDF